MTNSAGSDSETKSGYITVSKICVPTLVSPEINEILDNGCRDQSNILSWHFDWNNCVGATLYNLYVLEPSAANPLINVELTESEYTHSDYSYIIDANRMGWRAKVRAYVNGIWGDWSNETIFNVEPLNTDCQIGTVNDIDGNVYNTVTIGNQVWMKENLKTPRYNNLTTIPYVTDNTTWGSLTAPGYCWYNNNLSNKDQYGALYNWFTVNDQLCPEGWHVPSDSEWAILNNYLGGLSVAGGKMKSTGTIEGGNGLWVSPNVGATNESGFTAVPSGLRHCPEGTFDWMGIGTDIWSSTESDDDKAYNYSIENNKTSISRDNDYKQVGLSIRCIKNN